MLSVSSSSSIPAFGCPSLEDDVYNYSLNNDFYDQEERPAAAFVNFSENCAPGGDHAKGENGQVKKLNHNASERQRRKKINELYTSLRSLLPASEHSRRMSIPTTVARVLKYIPELQEEVERMEKKKQAMSKKIDRIQEPASLSILTGNGRHGQESVSDASSVTTSKVGDGDFVIHISAIQVNVYRILSSLEADGFQLVCCSSSETLHGRVLLNLHLEKQIGIRKMECKELDENIRYMLENTRS